MNAHEREAWLGERVALTERSSSILCAARNQASEYGTKILRGAHCYLYAALIADFTTEAKQAGFIGPVVQMDDSTTKPTEQFLVDHLFGTVFKPLFEQGGANFLSEARQKAACILGLPLATNGENRQPA